MNRWKSTARASIKVLEMRNKDAAAERMRHYHDAWMKKFERGLDF